MGYWCTLHLFDDQKFYSEVIPVLKGEKGDLTLDYTDFLKHHITGGTEHLSEHKINILVNQHLDFIIKISNTFNDEFKLNNEFNLIENYDNQRQYIDNLEGHYDFCKFFEYYLFKTCADFFPHIPLGKGGLSRNFNLDIKTLSYSIISELDHWNDFFCFDMMGITNWITHEDVELLYLDQDKLHFEDNKRAEGFLQLLEIAHKNKLGFIVGVDMREERLEVLPQNKLINSSIWKNINPIGMLFKR